MKALISTLAVALWLGAGAVARAQSCGSGGGATVCLTASGTPDNVQLNWTVSGSVSGLQVYRDTDADPNGRARIAQLAASTRSYVDGTAANGTPYWYWVKFTTPGGSYNSGAASAVRNASCTAASIWPWMNTNGTWVSTTSATVSPGTKVVFGPQASDSGTWSWSGCGTSGSAREQTISATASCSAKVVFTRSCGTASFQTFTLSVPGVMRDIGSVQLSKEMVPGINLGNTLDAPYETAWISTLTSQATMDGYKAAGFKSVRIPVYWPGHMDSELNIDPTWLARVKEVVDYARKAGLYAVVNSHWDQPLKTPTYANQASNNARLAKYWTQIANYFRDYDDHLLFAGMNEVGMDGTSGDPTQEWADVFNSYNQTFVNTVRATGGNNAKRHLVVQGYWTNIDTSVKYVPMPADSVAGRLLMEVHYYDPYHFTLDGSSNIWQWGAGATDPNAVETWANEPWADSEFQKMKASYLDKGYGVLIGEYGAYVKPNYPGMADYRKAWASYITRSIVQHGLVPMWWDTGELIDRATGAQKFPDVIEAIMSGTR